MNGPSRPLGSRAEETARLLDILESSDACTIADVAGTLARIREQRLVGQEVSKTAGSGARPLLGDADMVWPAADRAAGALRHGELTLDNVDEAFQYQPWNPAQRAAGAEVVEALVAAAKAILRRVPPCADRSVALRKIREARMDANSAITFNPGRL